MFQDPDESSGVDAVGPIEMVGDHVGTGVEACYQEEPEEATLHDMLFTGELDNPSLASIRTCRSARIGPGRRSACSLRSVSRGPYQ